MAGSGRARGVPSARAPPRPPRCRFPGCTWAGNEPEAISSDKKIKEFFKDKLTVESYRANLLCEPWEIKNNQGSYFKVFTPFYKKMQLFLEENFVALEEGGNVNLHANNINSLSVDDLNLLPKNPDWGSKFLKYFTMGEKAAYEKFHDFIDRKVANYAEGRNLLNKDICSALSPHLHFGEISVDYIFKISATQFS